MTGINGVILEQPEDLSQRAGRRILKATHHAIGSRWDREFMPRHFRRGARDRYNYKQRGLGYRQKKERLARAGLIPRGGKADLVFSGLLERTMVRRHNIRAFPARVTITLPGPSYFTSKPRNPNRPNMAAELTAVHTNEQRQLLETADKVQTRQIKKEQSRKKRKRIK